MAANQFWIWGTYEGKTGEMLFLSWEFLMSQWNSRWKELDLYIREKCEGRRDERESGGTVLKKLTTIACCWEFLPRKAMGAGRTAAWQSGVHEAGWQLCTEIERCSWCFSCWQCALQNCSLEKVLENDLSCVTRSDSMLFAWAGKVVIWGEKLAKVPGLSTAVRFGIRDYVLLSWEESQQGSGWWWPKWAHSYSGWREIFGGP